MRIKRFSVASGIGYHVYYSDGRYYIDLYRRDRPIQSYATIEGVKEALYYAGLICSKDSDIGERALSND